jgi:hypothetical protein
MRALGVLFLPLAAAADWWRESSLDNARSLALYMDRESRRYFVYREGTVVSSEKALAMYFEIARGPNVKTLCETGFNAGHSAAIWMNANPEARMFSFDLGQFDYTMGNGEIMVSMFGDRFELILGDSKYALPEFSRRYPDVKCDVVSVDGDHSTEGAYADLKHFRDMASCRNWVLMDDVGWNSTNTAWQKAKDDGIITQVECFVDLNPRPNYQFLEYPDNRSWCLGFFNVEGCPKLFNENPNGPVTRVRPLDVD